MSLESVRIGDQKIIREDKLTEEKRRYLRVVHLLHQMDEKEVQTAIDKNRVLPETMDFVNSIAEKVLQIRDGKMELVGLSSFDLDRLEDTFVWSRPLAQFSDAQKEAIAKWCRRDGHTELADNIEEGLKEEGAI